MRRPRRGQTGVVGVVLLVGIVAIGSISLLFVANATLSTVQQQAADERAQQAFAELGTTMTTTTADPDGTRAMEFAIGQQGAVVKEETGWIRLDSTSFEAPINLSIGTIEYEGAGGTRIAYQAGGVWQGTGTDTQVVTAPPIHYDRASETFTFPVTTVTGSDRLESGPVTVAHNRTQTFANASVVANDHVTITIHSAYYRGWQTYFATQAGETVVQDVDPDAQTVTVQIGYLQLEEAFDAGMTIGQRYEASGNPSIDESDYEYGHLAELDPVIEAMVNDTRDADGVTSYSTITGNETGGTFKNGTYYAEALALDQQLTANLSTGDITLVVDGDMTLDAATLEIVTDGTDNRLRVYTTGDVNIQGQDVCVDSCPNDTDGTLNASQLQVYGTSATHVSIGPGESAFEGGLYTASESETTTNRVHGNSCSAQVCLQSNVGFYGSLVAGSVEVTGGDGSIDFAYDPALQDVDTMYPEEYALPPQLTYLSIAQHKMDVTSE